ncbi:MAG: hypothetical protein KAT07_10055, partial [Calditrichia bacterium]|nr:hypothetical protein [Calditrichia bacterium]
MKKNIRISLFFLCFIFLCIIMFPYVTYSKTLRDSIKIINYWTEDEKQEAKEIAILMFRKDNTEGKKRAFEFEKKIRHRVIDKWESKSKDDIKDLIEKGATKEEAEKQVNKRIELARDAANRRVNEDVDIDFDLNKLKRHLSIILAISNLSHKKQLKLYKGCDIETLTKLLDCLCQSNDYAVQVRYHPTPYGISYSAHPALGSCTVPDGVPCVKVGVGGGCWRTTLPDANDIKLWADCIHSTDNYELFYQFHKKIDLIKKNYRQDVCEKIAPHILKTLRKLLKEGKIKSYSESKLATLKWFPTASMFAGIEVIPHYCLGTELRSLGSYLREKSPPSELAVNTEYVKITKKLVKSTDINCPLAGDLPVSYEMALALSIMSSDKKALDPADIFEMSVEITKGDLPLAMLVAHNFLKEAVYAKRGGLNMALIMDIENSNVDEKTQAKYNELIHKACEKGRHSYPTYNKIKINPTLKPTRINKTKIYLKPNAIY